MPSVTERRRNNVRAGLLVSISLFVIVAVIAILGDFRDRLLRPTQEYLVAFEAAQGVANLKPGSDVRVGGVRMGRVLAVEPDLGEDVFRRINVRFNIDRRVKMYADATVVVSAPMIGSEAWLDVPSVGRRESGEAVGKTIPGTPSAGVLSTLLGTEHAGKAGAVVENVTAFSEFLATIPNDYSSRILPALDDVASVAGDAKLVMADLREQRWPHWAASVDRVMTWAVDATPRLEAAIAEGHDLLSNTNAMVQENREPIGRIVNNVESATHTINTETIAKFHAVLDLGQQSLEQAKAALETLRVDYAEWATSISHALANANLTAQQLKLASIEVRRSPWKLLYRPTADELQHELLYEATRSFAVAAADLKATSDAVQRILSQHGERVSADESIFRRLERNLTTSLTNYENAQQRMLDVLVSDRKR